MESRVNPAILQLLEEGAVPGALPRSRHLNEGYLRMYLRAGTITYDTESELFRLTAVVSTVDMHPRYRGKGRFGRFMAEFEQAARERGYALAKVENVGNRALIPGLLKHGYVTSGWEEIVNSYYKELL